MIEWNWGCTRRSTCGPGYGAGRDQVGRTMFWRLTDRGVCVKVLTPIDWEHPSCAWGKNWLFCKSTGTNFQERNCDHIQTPHETSRLRWPQENPHIALRGGRTFKTGGPPPPLAMLDNSWGGLTPPPSDVGGFKRTPPPESNVRDLLLLLSD